MQQPVAEFSTFDNCKAVACLEAIKAIPAPGGKDEQSEPLSPIEDRYTDASDEEEKTLEQQEAVQEKELKIKEEKQIE